MGILGTDENRPGGSTALLGLKDAAALLSAIVASSSDAILSKTLDGTSTSWNAATEDLFGYSGSEMIGHSIRSIIPDDRQHEEDMILESIGSGRRIENYETRRIHKDGHEIDVSVTISPVRDFNGTVVGASKIIRDITERKHAEERIRSLLREVNHRANNMLAMVSAIARRTLSDCDELQLADFLGRIGALSLNQGVLIANEHASLPLKDLIESHVEPFSRLHHGGIIVRGPPLRILPEASQVLGMAIYELVTNAAKHGALSNKQGQVEIVWTANDERFTLEWLETKGPAVSPPAISGYGTTVLTRLVEKGLTATATTTYAPQGLSWRLKCPLRNVASKLESSNFQHSTA